VDKTMWRYVRRFTNWEARPLRLREPYRDWYRRGWLDPQGRLKKSVARGPMDRADLRQRMRAHLAEQAAPAAPVKRRRAPRKTKVAA
jgi:hypothetical protein